ncbi:MAG: hypothetical protein ACFFCW_49495, partial [Candidatus Hodarchaeota archaeon]
MKIRLINPSDDPRWDDFVSRHRFGSVYHHSTWMEVIRNTFPNTTPLYFVLENKTGELNSAIPIFLIRSWLTGNRLVSLPFSPFCDPLVDSLEDLNKLLEVILNKSKKLKASYLEMRVLNGFNLLNVTAFKENSLHFWKTYRLALEKEPDLLKKSFHKTAIQQRITRAEKNLKVR